MKIHPITRKEFWLAETVLFVAILLQIGVWAMGPHFSYGPQYWIILVEIALAGIIGISTSRRHIGRSMIHRPLSFLLLALMTIANISSFILVARLLITANTHLSGPKYL